MFGSVTQFKSLKYTRSTHAHTNQYFTDQVCSFLELYRLRLPCIVSVSKEQPSLKESKKGQPEKGSTASVVDSSYMLELHFLLSQTEEKVLSLF